MKNMKGFIFTLDALFALIVASLGVSIILYVHFTSPSLSEPQVGEALGVMQNLVQTKIGQAGGALYALYASRTGAASAESWPYYGGNAGLSSTGSYGPQALDLLFTYSASATITPLVSVDSGVVAFGAGSELYAINATTGKAVSGFPVSIQTSFSGSPAIYKGEVIYANSSGYLAAVSLKGGAKLWSSDIAVSIDTPIAIEDGFVTFGGGDSFYLVYPSNGTVYAYATLPTTVQLPAYSSGEFIVSTSTIGAQNYLSSYALNGNTLTRNWNLPLSTSAISTPSVYGGLIFIGNGSKLNVFTIGGIPKYSLSLDSQVFGSVAESGGSAFVETAGSVYSLNISTGTALSASLPPVTNENATPSASPYDLYLMPGGSRFIAFDISSGAMIWNFTFPSSAYSKYAGIALAYGNAYVASGSTLYAFGTCSASPNKSIASALGGFYLGNEGGCASAILNSVYPSSDTGLFINGTYAPSIKTAVFPNTSQHGVTVYQSPSLNKAWGGGSWTINTWFIDTNPPLTGTARDLIEESTGCTSGMWVYGNTSTHYTLNTIQWYSSGGLCTNDGNVQVNSVPVPFNKWVMATSSFFYNGLGGGYVEVCVNAQCTSTPWSSRYSSNYSKYGYNFLINDNDCCSGWLIGGRLVNVQLYSSALTQSQINLLYGEGINGAPVNASTLEGWWPLEGNANDYSGNNNVGIPNNQFGYSNSGYSPQALLNSYQISKSTVPLGLSVNGTGRSYNESVVIWK